MMNYFFADFVSKNRRWIIILVVKSGNHIPQYFSMKNFFCLFMNNAG